MSYKDLARSPCSLATPIGRSSCFDTPSCMFQSLGDLLLISICLDILAGVAMSAGRSGAGP